MNSLLTAGAYVVHGAGLVLAAYKYAFAASAVLLLATLSAAAAVHAASSLPRRPLARLGWLAVVIALPVAGPLLYLLKTKNSPLPERLDPNLEFEPAIGEEGAPEDDPRTSHVGRLLGAEAGQTRLLPIHHPENKSLQVRPLPPGDPDEVGVKGVDNRTR
jgi:hypothetical protein